MNVYMILGTKVQKSMYQKTIKAVNTQKSNDYLIKSYNDNDDILIKYTKM